MFLVDCRTPVMMMSSSRHTCAGGFLLNYQIIKCRQQASRPIYYRWKKLPCSNRNAARTKKGELITSIEIVGYTNCAADVLNTVSVVLSFQCPIFELMREVHFDDIR